MRVNNDHWDVLLDFSEKHREIITNRATGLDGRQHLNKLWTELANQLNCLGFGAKSVEEWKKTLADFKSKTKQKAAKINHSQNKTGGGPMLEMTLTAREERLLSLMGTKSIKGDSLLEFGINLEHQKSTAKGSENVNPQKRKHTKLPPCPRGSKYRNSQKTLTEQITDMNDKSLVVLKNINNNISNIALDIKRMADAVVKLCNKDL
ncbi:hypothetical protein RI129_003755 [Pyrocoelia pectoralis]|uniref:Regulatory protein zeste n=1 Tax=Pyrocoelia pectoralis TaxID=417401 RepID=A0AAN7ZGH1_9COLE